ncbi:VasL domain-containing protein [Yersinia pseudotuberculosis]|uniref:VasL domain-containing protein n=1 Tax=Yersinia pseudotuberculosis TaxID=633 RepID=UPI0028BEB87F|nr:VasL domain-containing protein [Yersinia pseudotuberculosis]
MLTYFEKERSRSSPTLSYLYQMQTELNREIPLEELLRQLAVSADEHQPASPVLIKQIDDRWNALLSRYHHLTQQTNSAR